MLYSTDRILTTHAGSLPRPADLREMVFAIGAAKPMTRRRSTAGSNRRSRTSCAGRPNAASTASMTANFPRPTSRITCAERIAGYEARPSSGGGGSASPRATRGISPNISWPIRATGQPVRRPCLFASALRYVGQAELAKDLDNFKAALAGRQGRRSLPAGQHPGHHRTLDDERILQERRGVRVRHRRRDA